MHKPKPNYGYDNSFRLHVVHIAKVCGIKEASEYLKVSIASIYRWRKWQLRPDGYEEAMQKLTAAVRAHAAQRAAKGIGNWDLIRLCDWSDQSIQEFLEYTMTEKQAIAAIGAVLRRI